MDYAELAAKLLQNMRMFHRARPLQHITGTLQGEIFVLHFVACQGGGVLPGSIGREMGVSSARIAAALGKLESKGLITRQIDINDRRQILVEATREGRDLAETYMRKASEVAEELLRALGERDAQEYVRITGRLAEITSERSISL